MTDIVEMIFKHNYARRESFQRVIYIEYHDGEVHAVVTDEFDGYQNHFDFEPDCRGIERFMFYHSGSGGKITELQPTHLYKKCSCRYWLHPKAKFKGTPKNITRLKTPIKYSNGDPNHFNHGREIYSTDYCKFCNKYYDENLCDDHHRINEDGELEYMDGSKID